MYTHSNAVAEARTWLWAGGTDVAADTRILTGSTVEVSYRPGAAGTGKRSRPGRVGSWK